MIMSRVVIELHGDADMALVCARLQGCGVWVRRLTGASSGEKGTGVMVLEPHSKNVNDAVLLDIPGVADVHRECSPYPRLETQKNRALWVGNVLMGVNQSPLLMAGPCSVESEEQIETVAALAKGCGATVLRGGAFKPRSSPYAYRGHGVEALRWLEAAARRHELAVVTEVMSERDMDEVASVADLIQIGARNMQNFSLLHAAGRTGKTLLLKRGMAATIEVGLRAGAHALAAGAGGVVFCERGIRSFDSSTRNLLDLSAVALLRHVHGLRVVVDPSHSLGRRDLILPMSRAAIAAGADGLLIEAHHDAGQARSDGPQALNERELHRLAREIGFVP